MSCERTNTHAHMQMHSHRAHAPTCKWSSISRINAENIISMKCIEQENRSGFGLLCTNPLSLSLTQTNSCLRTELSWAVSWFQRTRTFDACIECSAKIQLTQQKIDKCQATCALNASSHTPCTMWLVGLHQSVAFFCVEINLSFSFKSMNEIVRRKNVALLQMGQQCCAWIGHQFWQSIIRVHRNYSNWDDSVSQLVLGDSNGILKADVSLIHTKTYCGDGINIFMSTCWH